MSKQYIQKGQDDNGWQGAVIDDKAQPYKFQREDVGKPCTSNKRAIERNKPPNRGVTPSPLLRWRGLRRHSIIHSTMQYQLFSVMNVPSRPKIVIKKMMKKDSMMQEFELRKNQLECSAEQLKFSPTAARHRAVVARILWMVGMVITLSDYLLRALYQFLPA